jgi:hypothetical protein
MADTDKYYTELLGPLESEMGGIPGKTGKLGGLKKLFSGKGAKGLGAGMMGWWILDKILSARNKSADIGVQKEAIQAQASMATPENMYYQAAMPQAQEEEAQARQALFAQLSGGILGPSLAKGERMIGG